MDETWKDVVGWESVYQVSDLGRVKRTKAACGTTPDQILRGRKDRKGYPEVRLRDSSRTRMYRIHRLVLEAFVGKADNLVCNHKNGLRDDNSLSNLEWVTSSENNQHAYDVLGRKAPRGEHNGLSKLTEKDVLVIRRAYRPGLITLRQLAQWFQVCEATVQAIISRKTWRHVPDC